MIVEIFQFATCFVLGLLVGSLLTEAIILVPYWRRMEAKVFLNLHPTLGPKLYRYFAPLTIIATLLAIITANLSLLLDEKVNFFSILVAAILFLMLMIYYLYFKAANEKFKLATISHDELPSELKKWASWHWLRTIMGLFAFFFSILAMM